MPHLTASTSHMNQVPPELTLSIGYVFVVQSHFQHAEPLLQQAVEYWEGKQEEESYIAQTSLYYLGWTVLSLGRFTESAVIGTRLLQT
jgi:hypothetical protein